MQSVLARIWTHVTMFRPCNNQQKKKRTCQILDFAIQGDHRVKLKESKRKHKYLDLARELKNLWNMKVMFISMVIGALGTVTKGLELGLEDLQIRGRVETIQTRALLRSAWILRKVLETCCHSDSGEKPLAITGVKNSKGVIIIIMISKVGDCSRGDLNVPFSVATTPRRRGVRYS